MARARNTSGVADPRGVSLALSQSWSLEEPSTVRRMRLVAALVCPQNDSQVDPLASRWSSLKTWLSPLIRHTGPPKAFACSMRVFTRGRVKVSKLLRIPAEYASKHSDDPFLISPR